ncbi:hypothetical protein SLEP1_g53109 [Rubroshorea leprosula]|uniref:PGG domain-containing protein n=1 Tax=Rubroshorea leprosula TaxID=152421 RepID=A0AAV5M9H3_9ROSI|nr:hypothetical protein SLEP1_g53109 [Rubroshorea leprosula]
MEGDSGDGWYAFSNMQKSPTVQLDTLSDKFELLLSALETSLCGLQNSTEQIRKELIMWWDFLFKTRALLEDAKNRVEHDFLVKLWVTDMVEVLNDMEDILDEIMDASLSGLTAEVQSCANKTWKLILYLFNKVSRFIHGRNKGMTSKLKDIAARLNNILMRTEPLGLQNRLRTGDEIEQKNLERKQFDMLNAIYKGNLRKVRGYFQNNPDAISTKFENGETALHVAITAGQLRIAKELITSTRMANSHHLKIQDKSGYTALSFAARGGMMEIAKCLIEKNRDLLTIPDANKTIPVQLACRAGIEDMTRYLYCNTPLEFLDGGYGFDLLEECITKKMFDIAIQLLRHFPKFAIYGFFKDGGGASFPIVQTLAQTPPPFFRGNQLALWRRWAYNSRPLVSILPEFLAKQIYELKLMDENAHAVIQFICRRLSSLNEEQFLQSGAVEAAFQAIKNGIPEIVIEITKVNTNILWNCTDNEGTNLYECAIANRQEEVARFLYGFSAGIDKNKVFTTARHGNKLLHLAAKLAPRSHLNCISGAALQFQSELRWFKAVEGIVPELLKQQVNDDYKTPSEVFSKEHKQLLEEAEEWMKKTAESSTVVGALIITIMFAVAFTVPGGNDQNTGFPIFLNKTADSSTVSSPTVPFIVFVASDAISLFAASSSVLMFLGILTSRYADKDFLKSLPVKLIFGISLLFISIAAMMVAFCVALFIMLQGRLWIIIPVTLSASAPIIIFGLLQIPFLLELYNSTFRRGIFDGNRTTA